MPFEPSEEQAAFFAAIEKDQKSSFVLRARAGTGKTTTLYHALPRLKAMGLIPSKHILATAMGSAIVKELQNKFSEHGVQAKTMHSIGNGALIRHLSLERHERLNVDTAKYATIIRDDLQNQPQIAAIINSIGRARGGTDEKKQSRIIKRLFKDSVRFLDNLCDFGRAKLARHDDESHLTNIAWSYQLDDPLFNDEDLVGELVKRYPTIMNISRQMIDQTRTIDFTDMIYWVVKENASVWAYKCVLVDEIQDMNPMQRKLIQMVSGQGGRYPGRILGAGDDWQAIMGFAGADHDSFDLTVEAFDAKVLPLTVTRRCGKAIVLFCNDLVADFKAHFDNPDGQIRYIKDLNFFDEVKAGDFVAARKRSDLMRSVLGMLAKDMPATILGIDLSTWILELFEQLQEHSSYTTFEKVVEALDAMKAERLEEFEEKNDVMGAQNFTERCEALLFMLEAYLTTDGDKAEDNFAAYVKNRLGDVLKEDDYQANKERYIICSTIHKFKGLEADRVFILAPASIPLVYENQPPEARHQEDCLDYVLRSRARQEIIYVCDEDYRLPAKTLITLGDLQSRLKQLALPIMPQLPSPAPQLPAAVVEPSTPLEITPVLAALKEMDILSDIEDAEIIEEAPKVIQCSWCEDRPADKPGQPCETCAALGANPKWITNRMLPKYMPILAPKADPLVEKRQRIMAKLERMDAKTLDLFQDVLDILMEGIPA